MNRLEFVASQIENDIKEKKRSTVVTVIVLAVVILAVSFGLSYITGGVISEWLNGLVSSLA